jgi:Fe-S-cluster containining protein
MADNWRELLQFRCTCCGDCCREPIVLITDEDIRRIAARTGQAAVDIVDFYAPAEIEWSKKKPGWIKLKSKRKILGLRRTKESCQYQGDDDRCTIYEHRPVACRRYPFNLEMDEDGDIEFLSISNAVECPYELDGQISLEQLKATSIWEDAEEGPYHELVKKWNRRKNRGGKKRFLEFLGFR